MALLITPLGNHLGFPHSVLSYDKGKTLKVSLNGDATRT